MSSCNNISFPAMAQPTLLLAHGAGAGMDSPFMLDLDAALLVRGLRVVRFEFPYMQQRRADGRKRPPNPMPVLLEAFREQCRSIDGPLLIGGKSMGGRVASMLADELEVCGVVCFGYPFHPPGKPDKTRIAHLQVQRAPTLIVQGTRDPFGKPDEVSGYGLSESVRLHWLDTADHDFCPLKASGFDQEGMIEQAAEAVLHWLPACR